MEPTCLLRLLTGQGRATSHNDWTKALPEEAGPANAVRMVLLGDDRLALFGAQPRHSVGIESVGNFRWVEPDEPPDPQEWHPPLVHQPADMAPGHAEPLGELVHGQKLR